MILPCPKCRGFMYAQPEGVYRCLCGHEKSSMELKAEYLGRCIKRQGKESLALLCKYADGAKSGRAIMHRIPHDPGCYCFLCFTPENVEAK